MDTNKTEKNTIHSCYSYSFCNGMLGRPLQRSLSDVPILVLCIVPYEWCVGWFKVSKRLAKKTEPPPTRGVNPVKVRGPTGLYARDSGTDSANGGWLRRLVRQHILVITHHSAPESNAGLCRGA